MTELYDSIGQGYSQHRRPDVRIRHALLRALDGFDSIVNVGAGTGSYEPRDRFVVAVEPSPVMVRQRPPHAAPAVQASATALPFRDAAFDASTVSLFVALPLASCLFTAGLSVHGMILWISAPARWFTMYFPSPRTWKYA